MNGNIFRKPTNPNQPIWRYLNTDLCRDVDKFGSLIESQTLWLTKCAKLEKLEACYTVPTAQVYQEEARDFERESWESENRNMIHVNCWHANKEENLRMWLDYCGAREGIVILSTFDKLEEACNKATCNNQNFSAGLITYLDHRNDRMISPGNPLRLAMHKDGQFRHENEVRVCSLNTDGETVVMPIGLTDLVDGIYVHPFASGEYYDSIEAMISAKAPQLISLLKWSRLKKQETS